MSQIPDDPEFDRLLRDGMQLAFSGWDFSAIGERWTTAPIPWDYGALLRQRLPGVQSLLDQGTGGGEYLASLAPLPPDTWATEGYAPNVAVARQHLGPLEVNLVSNYEDEDLPFPNERFDLVMNRHESFDARELYRILKPGGTFFTQQVGGRDNWRLNELLQDEPSFKFSFWTLGFITALLEAAGFEILHKQEAFLENTFCDIGAVVYYLRIIQWQIEDFDITTYYEKLHRLHKMILAEGKLLTHSHRMLIEARKPA
ncbi:MAG: class I SAM-dependent methyltransferase [Anaerolineales bacterium]|nr:class I SAM-dependent methyltransferase [Anaerolineales bacterium]